MCFNDKPFSLKRWGLPALCSPDGVKVRKRPVNVVCRKKGVLAGPVDNDLVGSLTRGMVENKINSSLIDRHLLAKHMGRDALETRLGIHTPERPISYFSITLPHKII